MSSTAPASPDTPCAAADVIHNGNPYFDGKPASITREFWRRETADFRIQLENIRRALDGKEFSWNS